MIQSERIHPARSARTRFRVLVAGLAAIAISGAAAGTGEAAAPTCGQANANPNQLSRTTTARVTVCLLNAERHARGLAPLALNRVLSRAATRHSRDMVARHYFSHTEPSGPALVTRIRQTGYLRSARRWRVGENLAWGAGGKSTPKAIVRAWMHSPPHRKAILTRSYRDVGLGVVSGIPQPVQGRGATYTADFGVRR
jgi:uncharacterized protein YkwD